MIKQDGREKRRISAMRRVQDAALDLFEKRTFDSVTVEQIAAAAEVGAATVYRNFGSKERVVLWDEYDPMLLEAIAERLDELPVLDAVLEALIESLDVIYAEDKARILRRARFMVTEPALISVAASDSAALRKALAGLLLEKRVSRGELQADVLAGAITSALEAAVMHWLRAGGRIALATVLQRAFDALHDVGAPHGR